MIPAAFDYVRAGTVDEAVALLAKHGDDAKLLAGGHSLLPAMKLRLAQPRVLIDIGRIAELSGMREEDGGIRIGALTTHAAIAAATFLKTRCPLLPEVAECIGDVQVRNRGTLGGSLAHADPAADWPAAVLALDAEMEVVGPRGIRRIPAQKFFVDIFQTAIAPGEVLTAVHVPRTGAQVAYEKFAQKASGFAVAGVAVVLDGGKARVAVTGVAARPYRAKSVEKRLASAGATNAPFAARAAKAAAKAAANVEALSDIHASAEYRAHLAVVLARRALERAASRR